MIYHGHVANGQIVFHQPVVLPEGAQVRVDVIVGSGAEPSDDKDAPSLYDRMKLAIGTEEGLPPDAARNLDHYLYGHPKR